MKMSEETKKKIRKSKYHSNLTGENNPFYGKKHTKESIDKWKSHPNYINREMLSGENHPTKRSEVRAKMRKPKNMPNGKWNHQYRHDVKYEGKDRIKIIEWCRLNNAIPDEIALFWFKSCDRCGWDKSKCDLHHIISKNKGGKSNRDNLVVLCPNCHRLEHFK